MLLFVFQLNDLRELLYNTAVSHGAEVRFGAEVTAVESREHTVSLSSGEVLSADVIIGADGLHGPCRQVVLEEDSGSSSDDSRSEIDQGLNLYKYVVNCCLDRGSSRVDAIKCDSAIIFGCIR